MIRLELTEDEARTLHDVLRVCVSDLSMEIADTDLKDFRDGLKRKKALLDAIATRIEASPVA
jgi:hypothetical protein